MRALGIDLGTQRIGVALSDSAGSLATPYEVVKRCGDRARDHSRIADLAREVGAECLVVGLPLRLDGTAGPAAQAAISEADELALATGLPVEMWDERLTTVTADRDLLALDMKAPARRRVVDKVAASVMLQAWLDHRRLTQPQDAPDD
ncbi:MAG: Holliday junction resolvase RuvX [Actinomycetota bacterium]